MSTSRLTLTPVAPTGTSTGLAFVDYADGHGAIEPVTSNTYPPSAFDLRALRRELGLTLGATARILGVSVTEVSSLERGSLSTDWTELERLLRGRG